MPVTITLQALSLVERTKEPVQVRCFTLRLATNGVCECKMDVKSTWIPTWHRMDHVSWSLGLHSKTTSWRQVQHKIRRPWHSKCSDPLIYVIWSCVRIRMDRNVLIQQFVEGKVAYDFTPHFRVRDHTTQFCTCIGTAFNLDTHGHSSWLVCEVVLTL